MDAVLSMTDVDFDTANSHGSFPFFHLKYKFLSNLACSINIAIIARNG